jgi:hypothetical protein
MAALALWRAASGAPSTNASALAAPAPALAGPRQVHRWARNLGHDLEATMAGCNRAPELAAVPAPAAAVTQQDSS